MRLPVARHAVREVRGAALWTAASTAAMALLVTLIYPAYSEGLADFELPEFLEGLLGEAGSLASPVGFLSSEFFSWIPPVVAGLALVWGTRALAGAEAAGRLDLLLAQPLARRRVFGETALALGAVAAGASVAALPALLAGAAAVGMDVSAVRLGWAVLLQAPLAVLFAMLGLLLGALLPTPRAASGTGLAILVGAWFVNTVGATVEGLDVLRAASPFRWADASAILLHGPDPARAGAGLVAAGILAAAGAWAFDRREIGAAHAGPPLPAAWRILRGR